METESSTVEGLEAERSYLDSVQQEVDTIIRQMIDQKKQNSRAFEAQTIFKVGGGIGQLDKIELEGLAHQIGQKLYKRSDESGVISLELPITRQMVEGIDGVDPNTLKYQSPLLARNYQARVRYHPENGAVDVLVERKPVEISPDGRLRKYPSSGGTLKPIIISYYIV